MRILLCTFLLSITLSYYMDPTMAGYSPYLVSTGGKYSQRIDGSNSVFNNPSNLVFYKNSGRLFSSNLYDDVNIINLSLSGKVAANIFVGVGYSSLFVDNIFSTSIDSVGKILAGNPIRYKNNMYSFSAAMTGNPIGHGVSVKIIDGAIDNNTATGIEVSYGAYYLVSDKLVFNLMIDNLLASASPIRWSTGYSESLPPSITLASAYLDDIYGVSGGLTWAQLNSRIETYYNLSVTWKVLHTKNMGLEASVAVYTDTASPFTTYSVGMNFYYQGIMFSYALAPCALAGKDFVHMFSAGYNI